MRGKPLAREGEPPKSSIIVITFPSLDDAEKWYGTPPHKDLVAERQKAAKGRFYIVEGVPQ